MNYRTQLHCLLYRYPRSWSKCTIVQLCHKLTNELQFIMSEIQAVQDLYGLGGGGVAVTRLARGLTLAGGLAFWKTALAGGKKISLPLYFWNNITLIKFMFNNRAAIILRCLNFNVQSRIPLKRPSVTRTNTQDVNR